MIIVDGQKSEKNIANFANLEELLLNIMQEESMKDRVVTDVLVNNEVFTELYPHQAEDLSKDDLNSVEIRTVPASQMAIDISSEMDKVVKMMISGATNVARLFREEQNSEALELLQDLLDVTRDFLTLISDLRKRYLNNEQNDFDAQAKELSDLLSEMSEVLGNEDWVLLADLLEYEFLPQCEKWQNVTKNLHQSLLVRLESQK